jgi:rhomboid protease GluP
VSATGPVEVHRSRSRAACEERALVLHAVGIAAEIGVQDRDWLLYVDALDAAEAHRQLQRYEHENPPRGRPSPPLELQPGAWIGALAWAGVLLAVGYLAGRDAFATDWFGAGTLQATAVRAGEAWRGVTALTLHFDVGHLLGNLGFGLFFGTLAAQLAGPGAVFGAAVVAASLANLGNAAIAPGGYVSAGASTAVFALLGLLAAYARQRRATRGERWAYRWAPLVAGVAMLGFTGAGGERTDLAAHLSGFVAGAAAGWLLSLLRRPPGPAAQWLAGLGTLALLAGAWALALSAPA